MEYRKLGRTDMKVSAVGFGCWAIGGHGYGKMNDADSISSIRYAFDKGINFFDTADVYGFGHSEKILAEALGKDRHAAIIATKFGVSWDSSGRTYKDISPKRVTEAVDASLKRLKLEQILLYQIHWPDDVTPIEETVDALLKCQKAGKIRYIGCSNLNTDQIGRAQRVGRLESAQCLYNVMETEHESDIRAITGKHGMGIIGYSLICRGLLSGKFSMDTHFGEGDTRGQMRGDDPDRFEALLSTAKKIKLAADRHSMSSVQMLIRIALGNTRITSGLIGMTEKSQVDDCVGAFGADLQESDIQIIVDEVTSAGA